MATNLSRRDLLKLFALTAPTLSACSYLRIDMMSPFLRSDIILSPEQEREIVSRGSLEWTDDGRIRVLTVRGTPYERGYQHGALLRKEIQDNFGYMWEQSLKKFRNEELFDEAYERQRRFLPNEYAEEMHGLAHGSKMPLRVIHGIHALPEITEWGGKRRMKEVIKHLMAGDWATSCSNLAASSTATKDGSMYVVRVLDWGLHRISKLHEYPLITINLPESGFASANIGWVGFLGAVSGMNERGITLGEMGYGDRPVETMYGKPMPFLLRDIMTHADSLADVRKIISESKGTNSFIFLMSDGKRKEAEMYVRDPSRFLTFKPGEDIRNDDKYVPAVANVVYGGHFNEKMTESLQNNFGAITPEKLMNEMIPQFAMKSNFQNVVYDPGALRFWVSNAKSKDERAAEQPYTFFDFKAKLEKSKNRA